MVDLAVGRTVTFHTRWMEFYSGDEQGLPSPHFRWLIRTGEQGGETENFKPLIGKCYGYVPFHTRTNIEKLGGVPKGGDASPGTLVVFTATSPEPGAGAKVVGWYEDAQLYVDSVARPSGNRSPCKATTSASDAYLLAEDARVFSVPRMKTGYPGMSPLTYLSSLNPEFEAEIVGYLNKVRESGIAPVLSSRPDEQLQNRRLQSDPLLKAKVEKAAIKRVTAFYEDLGVPITSCERDNVGWDLESANGLRIEVKGRSANVFEAELTPNEYRAFHGAMQDAQLAVTYRLAIVADALNPNGSDLSIFAFINDRWQCEITRRVLAYAERAGARVGVAQE